MTKRRSLGELTLLNRFLFAETMEDPENLRILLEIILGANSHFLRPAGPHFPASQGHIKRSALEIGRARGAPPC